jgi:IPT/TIG domain
VGPDSGGTVITISLFNFPTVNSVKPKAVCQFPGFETSQTLTNFTAINVNSTTVTCTTPPLSSSDTAISTGRIQQNTTFAISKVILIMLDSRAVYTLNFVYMRNVTITQFSPENVWFHAPDITRRVLVFGQNFLPLSETIVCRL